jgi:hypothetical protein
MSVQLNISTHRKVQDVITSIESLSIGRDGSWCGETLDKLKVSHSSILVSQHR